MADQTYSHQVFARDLPSTCRDREKKKPVLGLEKIAAIATERIYSQFMADLVVRKDVD